MSQHREGFREVTLRRVGLLVVTGREAMQGIPRCGLLRALRLGAHAISMTLFSKYTKFTSLQKIQP